jgi:hypothetical protein
VRYLLSFKTGPILRIRDSPRHNGDPRPKQVWERHLERCSLLSVFSDLMSSFGLRRARVP